MTCACCETGRCCGGPLNADCQAGTKSQCAFSGGAFSAGGDCASYACTDNAERKVNCFLNNACACSSGGYSPNPPYTTCNCNTLTAAGVPSGGCASFYCFSCNTANGGCEYSCPSPRECCAGVCCPESQMCPGNACIDKCSAGSTYCPGLYGAYSCCPSTQKCCGSSGCLPALSDFTVDVAVDTWVNTGVTVLADAIVTITATGSCDRCAPGTVEWNGQGSAATPNGVPAGACAANAGANVSGVTFCHMSLIGRIGTNGVPFLVGSSYSGKPGAGTLFLRQNDVVVFDNRGVFTGTINADPCPGYTPASVGEPVVFGAGENPHAAPPGPGAELKGLLKLVGIVASATCSCNARASQMDSWGEWECLKRLPEITGWLKEEAGKRGMWFCAPAGVAVLLAAIALSALKRPFRDNNK